MKFIKMHIYMWPCIETRRVYYVGKRFMEIDVRPHMYKCERMWKKKKKNAHTNMFYNAGFDVSKSLSCTVV